MSFFTLVEMKKKSAHAPMQSEIFGPAGKEFIHYRHSITAKPAEGTVCEKLCDFCMDSWAKKFACRFLIDCWRESERRE